MFEESQKLLEQMREYLDTRIDLIKLQTAKKLSAVISSIMGLILAAMFGFIAVLMFSMALAWWLSDITGSLPLGFSIVGLLFVILCGGLWLGREKILRIPVMNEIIKQLFKEDAQEK